MSRTLPSTDRLPHALYRAGQVRALDRAAIDGQGIPGAELMARAGAAAFALLKARWPAAGRVLVLVGTGNNGGDGYVIARLALDAGLSVQVLQLGDRGKLGGDARAAADAYSAAGGRAEPFRKLPADAELIVDALLGTGLERPVTADWAEAIAQVNRHPAPVLAVDIPSGLHADTGRVLGIAVEADATISFIGLKQGMFTGRGRDHCGDIRFDGLRVPAAIYASEILAARRADWPKAQGLLPQRRASAHKGDCGRVLIIGGAPSMTGAARLAGEAALRTGAGLVTVATHPQHAAMLNLARPELMVHAVADPSALDPVVAQADVVAIGPGLGQGVWGATLFGDLLDRPRLADRPMVVDADALNLLARAPRHRDAWVLTPHPGEAARLLGTGVAEIEQDRFAAVRAIQQRFGGVAVLKGAGTLIQGPGHRPLAVCSQGNPGMASGGMGDALTGIIAALIGQGLDIEEAAEAGVCLHAAAGDAAAAAGQRGLLASDLIEVLRETLSCCDAG